MATLVQRLKHLEETIAANEERHRKELEESKEEFKRMHRKDMEKSREEFRRRLREEDSRHTRMRKEAEMLEKRKVARMQEDNEKRFRHLEDEADANSENVKIWGLPYIRVTAGEIVALSCGGKCFGGCNLKKTFRKRCTEDFFLKIGELFGMESIEFCKIADRVTYQRNTSAHITGMIDLECRVKDCMRLYQRYPDLIYLSEDQYFVLNNWSNFRTIILHMKEKSSNKNSVDMEESP